MCGHHAFIAIAIPHSNTIWRVRELEGVERGIEVYCLDRSVQVNQSMYGDDVASQQGDNVTRFDS